MKAFIVRSIAKLLMRNDNLHDRIEKTLITLDAKLTHSTEDLEWYLKHHK